MTADDKANKTKSGETPISTSVPKKKSNSPGFIDTTNFKPSWLETGPLTPDMLPPELMAQVVEEASSGNAISDELLEQIAKLEQLYNESLDAEDAARAAPIAEVAEEVVAVAAEEPAPVAVEPEPHVDVVVAAQEEPAVAVAPSEPEPTAELAAIAEAPPAADPLPLEAAPVEAEVAMGTATTIPDDFDDFIVEPDDFAAAVPVAAPTAVPAKPAKPAKPVKPTKARRRHPLFDRMGRVLALLGLVLLGLAAVTYFINPFARLALSTAELARPVSSPEVASPAGAETNWCVSGDFLGAGDAPIPMSDSGNQGDIIAGDQVFALQTSSIPPGSYQWQVVGCELGDLAFPPASSWLQVDVANQPVTFTFDSKERDDALFFPIPFAVSAIDSAKQFQVVGSFQDWNVADPSAALDHLGGGIYQQVRRIARPGIYEAYIVSGDSGQAIDAYGRTVEPIPFSFETSRASETVVFLLDTNRGRASVLYGMPQLATQLAYGMGFRALSLILGLGGLLLLVWMFYRMLKLGNQKNWLEAGCPQCGHQELMRINRKPVDHFLNAIGIPSYRYQCRNCTWTGGRLSEEGASVSPGASTIVRDVVR